VLERNASPRDIETCPIQVLENISAGYWPDQSIKNVEIDFTKLESILSSVPNTEACVILTKDWLGKNLKSKVTLSAISVKPLKAGVGERQNTAI